VGALLYILTGQDDFSLRCSLEKLKVALGDPSLLEANTITLDGHKLPPGELRTACETLPFLAEKRLVIVDGLLGRFEPKVKGGQRKKTLGAPKRQDNYRAFATSICNLPDSTVLVFIDGKIKSSNPLFKELLPRAEVRSFPLLSSSKLRQWIKGRVTQEGGSISPQAVELLARLVGGNLWAMVSEIRKLVLFTSGRQIEEDDVKTLVSHTQQASVFTMVDAILEFRIGLAEQALQELLQVGVAPAYLLFMLSRQVRQLVRAKELRKAGQSEGEIQDRLGITYEFALRKTLEQAGRFSLGRLRELYQKLLEADLAIKTGKYGGELALNILVAELCQKHGRQAVT
jgi:DNA polymerase-3 subunit delta